MALETEENDMNKKATGTKVGFYVRVSTDGQTVENQLRELRAVAKREKWKIVSVFRDDGISGAKGRDKRPGFNDLCKSVTQGKIDMVAAWSVDRLGRSLQDLATFLTELHAKDVDLYLHQQGLDTSTPAGRAMFGMMAVFAEFERAMIQERIKAGLARTDKKSGRPRVSAKIEEAVREARAAGKGQLKISRELGIGVSTVRRILSE